MRYGWQRLLQTSVVVAVALSLNFALPRLAPGDPLTYLFGPEAAQLTLEQRRQVLSEFGLDRPLAEQFIGYLAGLARGELGTSVRFGRPVLQVIGDRIGWTVALVGGATLLSAVIGTLSGVMAARQRGRLADLGLLTAVLLLDSVPAFWVAMVLVAIFAGELGWLPAFGAVPLAPAGSLGLVAGVASRMLLPLATLTMASVGTVFLIARASVALNLAEGYVRTARAKGVDERGIMLRHVLRNGLLPVYTTVSISLGHLLGGAMVIETVFSLPGLGRLLYEGILARDYPLLQGTLLLVTVGVVVANLVADLTYPLLDPRIRNWTT